MESRLQPNGSFGRNKDRYEERDSADWNQEYSEARIARISENTPKQKTGWQENSGYAQDRRGDAAGALGPFAGNRNHKSKTDINQPQESAVSMREGPH